jgi:NADPH-dependent 2,4-dienoyl-CoA reductase/sulfur reductase-like enzyme/rhodanese-related sulfurtransferase
MNFQTRRQDVEKTLRIVVVGGVAGGATAAAKARRENETAEIVIYERGPYVSFANCGLPYYIGGVITERSKLLVQTPEGLARRYRIDVRTRHEVLSIERKAKQITVRGPDGAVTTDRYDRLILSQGAAPIVPPLPGARSENVFTLRTLEDMDAIDAFLTERKPQSAAVVGGGFIGLEMAEALLARGLRVTIVEMLPQLLSPLDPEMAAMVESHLLEQGVRVVTGNGLAEVLESSVRLQDGSEVPAEMVLMSVGVRPETTLAREAGLAIGTTGGVRVNGRMQSSDPDIYVVGDEAEVPQRITGEKVRIPLAGPANRQGRVAGANAAGGHLVYRGALGTSIVKVCEIVAGSTGMNERTAREKGIGILSSFTTSPSHASYYPGATPMTIKLVASDGSGVLLGAQVVGRDGVDKRLDVLATAISAGMSVEDLEHLDLAYAPPFGSPNDPVNVAGFVASHLLRGETRAVTPAELQGSGRKLVDVREPSEIARQPVPGAVSIPLGELRGRLGEMDRDAQYAVTCQVGLRGYLACRVLGHHGFDAANVAGGVSCLEHALR